MKRDLEKELRDSRWDRDYWQQKYEDLRNSDDLEKLRLWIWEQIDKHGEELVAVQPVFDLILNKIDEIKDGKNDI